MSLPRFVDLLRSMWDRAWAFIKKAGTIILLATIVVWFLSGYGIYEGQFMWVGEDLMDYSFLAYFGNAFAWIFAPLGFNNWECASTVITGLIAKENVISTITQLVGGNLALLTTLFTPLAAYTFLVFVLLYTPCVMAIITVRNELGGKYAAVIVVLQCVVAWIVAFIVHGIGLLLGLG